MYISHTYILDEEIKEYKLEHGGERGIRTPGTDEGTHPFQGCTIDHSDTSPE